MPCDPNVHHRHSTRLQSYDYSRGGAYFVTICTQDRARLLGEVLSGQMCLSSAGQMISDVWASMPTRFPTIVLDTFVVMPDHVHGVVMLCDEKAAESEAGNEPRKASGTLPGTIGRILQAFKSISTHAYTQGVKHQGWSPFTGRLWQRNYYEHIIRSEQALERFRAYIDANPSRWAEM